jgi:hypothetical protein
MSAPLPLGQIHNSFIVAVGRVEMRRLLMPLIVQITPQQQIDYARVADELHGASLDDLRRNICASIACRAAIKINMPLDARKMLLRARRHRLSDELPPRPPHRHALLDPRHLKILPPDLRFWRVPLGTQLWWGRHLACPDRLDRLKPA